MIIDIASNSLCLSSSVNVPNTFWQRAKGLLGKKNLKLDEMMLFYHCNSVHMFGMKFSLDIIYLNEKFEIIKIVKKLKPWRFSGCIKANHTLEMAAGLADTFELQLGEKLLLKENKK